MRQSPEACLVCSHLHCRVYYPQCRAATLPHRYYYNAGESVCQVKKHCSQRNERRLKQNNYRPTPVPVAADQSPDFCGRVKKRRPTQAATRTRLTRHTTIGGCTHVRRSSPDLVEAADRRSLAFVGCWRPSVVYCAGSEIRHAERICASVLVARWRTSA